MLNYFINKSILKILSKLKYLLILSPIPNPHNIIKYN